MSVKGRTCRGFCGYTNASSTAACLPDVGACHVMPWQGHRKQGLQRPSLTSATEGPVQFTVKGVDLPGRGLGM